jgi:hypothetical protein
LERSASKVIVIGAVLHCWPFWNRYSLPMSKVIGNIVMLVAGFFLMAGS